MQADIDVSEKRAASIFGIQDGGDTFFPNVRNPSVSPQDRNPNFELRVLALQLANCKRPEFFQNVGDWEMPTCRSQRTALNTRKVCKIRYQIV
jgi:hypothetical protein